MLNFAESGHPILRATNALERGELKSKRQWMKSIQPNGSDETIELILRTIISVNQLSVYSAVADMRGEFARYSKGTGNRERLGVWNQGLSRQNVLLLIQLLRHMPKYKEICCVNMSRNSQIFLNKRNWPNSRPMLVSQRILGKGNSWLHLMMIHLTNWWGHVESIFCFDVMNDARWRVGSAKTRRSGQSWMWWSVIIKDVTVWKSWSILFFRERLLLGFVSWTETTNT